MIELGQNFGWQLELKGGLFNVQAKLKLIYNLGCAQLKL